MAQTFAMSSAPLVIPLPEELDRDLFCPACGDPVMLVSEARGSGPDRIRVGMLAHHLPVMAACQVGMRQLRLELSRMLD
jgi:hypothetical protein